MDIATISQIISTVGFPIAACIAIYIQSNKQAERHDEEIAKINEALANNTKAILELSLLIREGCNDGTK